MLFIELFNEVCYVVTAVNKGKDEWFNRIHPIVLYQCNIIIVRL